MADQPKKRKAAPKGASKVAKKATKSTATAAEKTKKTAKRATKKAENVATKAAANTKKAAGSTAKKAEKTVENAAEELEAAGGAAVARTRQSAQAAIAKVEETASVAAERAKTTVDAAASSARQAATRAAEATSEFVDKATEKIDEAADNVAEKTEEVADAAATDVVDTASGWWRDLLVATRFLTIVPVPAPPSPSPEGVADARRAFVLVGFGLGLASALVYGLAHLLNLGAFAAALMAIATAAVLTRGQSEQGLGDFIEGLAAGQDKASRLRAVQDGALGYAGIAAVGISILLRAVLITLAAAQGAGTAALIAALIAGYAAMPQIASSFPAARGDKLDGLALDQSSAAIWVSTLVGALLILVFLAGSVGLLSSLVALVLAAVGAAKTGWLAQKLTGGTTTAAVLAGSQIVQIFVLVGAVAHF